MLLQEMPEALEAPVPQRVASLGQEVAQYLQASTDLKRTEVWRLQAPVLGVRASGCRVGGRGMLSARLLKAMSAQPFFFWSLGDVAAESYLFAAGCQSLHTKNGHNSPGI